MKPPCESCRANCCHYVPVSPEELKKMMAAKPRAIPKWKIKKQGLPDFLVIMGKCPWVGKDHKCEIYEDRPMICRMVGTEQIPCEKMPGFEAIFGETINRIMKHAPKGK